VGFLGLRLHDDRDLDLRGFAFDWNGLVRLLQAIDVTTDGIFNRGSCVIQIVGFRYKAWQGGYRDGISAILVGLEKRGVFARLASGSFRLLIIDQDRYSTLSF
jgi:hypothetical protein